MSTQDSDKQEPNTPSDLPEDPALSYDPHQTKLFTALSDSPISETLYAPAEEEPDAKRAESDSDSVEEQISLLIGVDPEQGGFRLRRLISTGGFGEIWEAEQRSLSRIIAVKRLREELEEKAQSDVSAWRKMKQSFLQEALTTANLEHPNILPIYDHGYDEEGHPVLAMKLIKGRPWSEMIHDDAAMPIEDFLARHLPILIDVAQAVAYSHSRGVLHRDIKPAQVMVGEFGEVLLADWGLAIIYDLSKVEPRHLRGKSPETITTTENASSPSGTVAFMAPEQTLKSPKDLGPWTDIYLLGGTLYYLLTFSYPHNAPEVKAAFAQARHGFVESPEDRRPEREAPQELSLLCRWMLTPDIKSRPNDVGVFIKGLQDYLSGSSSRKQSREATREIEKRYWAGCHDYDQLDLWEGRLSQALGLWPGNADARRLHQKVIHDYSEAAFENGDLKLARVELRRLETGPERDALEQRIAEKEVTVAHHRRQRGFFLYCTVGLLVAAAVLAFVSNSRRVEAERSRRDAESNLHIASTALESAQYSRKSADAARKHAEDLIRFMIHQMHRPGDARGTSDQLTIIIEDTRRSLAVSEPSDELRAGIESEAQSLSDVSTLLAANGALPEALVSISSSKEITRALLERFPDDEGLTRLLAERLKSEGELLRQLLRFEEAKEALIESIKLADSLTPAGDQRARHLLTKGEAALSLGRVYDSQNDSPQATIMWEEAARYLREANEVSPDVQVRRNLAMAMLLLGRREEAKPFIEEQLQRSGEQGDFMRLLRQNGLPPRGSGSQ